METERSIDCAREEEIEIDLRQILNVLKKWSKLIIAGTLLCAITAGIISYFVLPPIYQAQTLLMVTQATDKLQSTNQGEDLEDVVGTVSRLPVWTMNTYLGQIESEALMKRVIKSLELENVYSAANLSNMIEAKVVKDSNLIDLRVTNGDPYLVADIANVLSQEYLQLMTEKNQEQISRSMGFLETQKEINDKELQKAIQALKDFESQPRGVAVLESTFNSETQDMVTFGSRLKMVRLEIEQLKSGISRLEQELDATPEIVSTSALNENSSNTSVGREINPLYISLSQMLVEKKAGLAEKIGEAEGLEVLLTSITADLDGLQAELSEKRAQQDALEREVQRLKNTSETLAQKGIEAQIVKSINLGDTSVIVLSEASTPFNPIKPNKKLNIAIAMILGLMIFTLLAFVLEYLDNTLKTPEDINKELGLPVLGVIPLMTKENCRQSGYGG